MTGTERSEATGPDSVIAKGSPVFSYAFLVYKKIKTKAREEKCYLEEKTHLGVPFFGCSRLVMPFSGCARLQVPFYRFSRQGCGWSARWRLEEWEIGASKSHAGWLSMRDPQATSCRDGDAVQRRQARRFNLGEQDIPVVWQHDADARCRGHHMRCAVETKVGVDASHLRRDI
jgi:hypothetical protein